MTINPTTEAVRAINMQERAQNDLNVFQGLNHRAIMGDDSLSTQRLKHMMAITMASLANARISQKAWLNETLEELKARKGLKALATG